MTPMPFSSGLSAAAARVTTSAPFAGVYRQHYAWPGAVQMTKLSEIPTAVKSTVAKQHEELAEV